MESSPEMTDLQKERLARLQTWRSLIHAQKQLVALDEANYERDMKAFEAELAAAKSPAESPST
jgi:hypothetical protein